MSLTPTDLEDLKRRSITRQEAERQLGLLRSGTPHLRLDRPATLGDGIEAADNEPEQKGAAANQFAAPSPHPADLAEPTAPLSGIVCRFVPASGVASRMFADLQSALANPHSEESRATLARFDAARDRFPFQQALRAASTRGGTTAEILQRLLFEKGGLAWVPKATLPFHRDRHLETVALTEHLHEMSRLVGAHQPSHVHFTTTADHEPVLRQHALRAQRRILRARGAALECTFSHQSSATETLSLDADGQPLRAEDGRLVFRPGGHGALLRNLERLQGDTVLIKNIDNVLPAAHQEPTIAAWRSLLERLAALRAQVAGCLNALQQNPSNDAALRAGRTLVTRHHLVDAARTASLSAGELIEVLDRPTRVCGMVRNTGEPGGGPFWVNDDSGHQTLHIVEAAQIDAAEESQRSIFAASTHFNPVFFVGALKSLRGGTSYQLANWRDDNAPFVSTKTRGEQSIRILEHPGLWNGGMAGWLTVFVEVPAEVFAPVKTVWDLLRPAHQTPNG